MAKKPNKTSKKKGMTRTHTDGKNRVDIEIVENEGTPPPQKRPKTRSRP